MREFSCKFDSSPLFFFPPFLADAWIQELNKSAPVNSLRLIVGNKCDLEDQREVSHEQATVNNMDISSFLF